ncbi:hypothetical protein Tco_0839297 [Tanacetum coccineum]|uniref:Uncharacterized protein n=1 Tax=Tanacetum coccineum TaxID=301880 RepID=A0ABQ5AQ82_9ASTR
MSCSNHHPNFSGKPRMLVRQVWKRKTFTSKSTPSSQKDSPPFPPRVHFQSPLPPSYNPLRDQMINQLHNISTILDSHTNPSNTYIHVPPSPPPQPIHPPSHAQVKFHSSFCHINNVKQGGSSVADYYHRLNSFGREFGAMTKLPKCVCEVNCACAASSELVLHQQLMKLM